MLYRCPARQGMGARLHFLVDQHFIAPIQIRERHPRLHRTSAASGDFLFIQWPPTYFQVPLEPSRAWGGGASTPRPGPLRDRRDSNPDWQWRLQCCYQLRHSGPAFRVYPIGQGIFVSSSPVPLAAGSRLFSACLNSGLKSSDVWNMQSHSHMHAFLGAHVITLT